MAFECVQFAAGLTLSGLLTTWHPADQPQASQLLRGLRIVEADLAELVAEGRERSSTFRKMIGQIDDADWIVFVQEGSCRMERVSACLLHRIGAFHGRRYLRIVISATGGSDDEVIATIGHELQHATEVINAVDVATTEDIVRLYARIGYIADRTTTGVLYETAGATQAAATIRRELRASRRTAQEHCRE